MALAGGEKSDDKYNTISQVNGRTDGQTDRMFVSMWRARMPVREIRSVHWLSGRQHNAIQLLNASRPAHFLQVSYDKYVKTNHQ